MNCFLGIDIGSSSAKIGLIDRDGVALAVLSRLYSTSERCPGYKEQSPGDWWSAVCEGICNVLRSVPGARVQAVGSTGHISSMTFVRNDGKPLRNSIAFQDLRAVDEVKDLYAAFSRQELNDILAIDLPPAPTWPLPRLLWMLKHEPETLAGARYLLQAKDYVNFLLTGVFASDASSNRGLVDIETGKVATRVFTRLGLPDLLPPIFDPGQVVGAITERAAKETGLPAGLPVVTGWNDLNAGVLGSGITQTGQLFDLTGTSEHIGIVVENRYKARDLICAPYLPGKRLLYGVMTNGGGPLEWFRQFVGKPMGEVLAGAAECDSEILFLPYLEGERCPVWDPRASGVLLGLRGKHGQNDVARAVIEGVSFGLRQNFEAVLETVKDSIGFTSAPLVVSGGASTSSLWSQIKADVLNKEVITLLNPHAGIQGAAILAAVAAGVYPNLEIAAKKMTELSNRYNPRKEHHERADRMFAVYKEIYPGLQKTLTRLSNELDSRQNHGGDMNSEEAVVFGGGKIARGFISHLLTLSGYHITFVEKNPALVSLLRTRGRYLVEIMGAPEKSITITGFDVIASDESDAVADVIAKASVIFVSIGGPNLPQIAPLLAAGLEKRNTSINIILGENYFEPAKWLRTLIMEKLPVARRQWFADNVGVVETMILRSTIEPTLEMKNKDPLSLKAQDAWEIPADKEAFVGEIPPIQGLSPRENFQGGLVRKLFTYNCINAVIAYMGQLKGYTLLGDAAHDPEILALARAAYNESSRAICLRYKLDLKEQNEFAEAAIRKYQNRDIVDPIERNGRDPIRKLGRNDRMVGPACLALEYGKKPVALSKAIAAALLYDNPEDAASIRLRQMIAAEGVAVAVCKICGLDSASELVSLVVKNYQELSVTATARISRV